MSGEDTEPARPATRPEGSPSRRPHAVAAVVPAAGVPLSFLAAAAAGLAGCGSVLAWATFLTWLAASWLLPLGVAAGKEGIVETGGVLAAAAISFAVANLWPPLSVRGKGTPVIGLRLAVVGLVVTACYGVVYVADRRGAWLGWPGAVILGGGLHVHGLAALAYGILTAGIAATTAGFAASEPIPIAVGGGLLALAAVTAAASLSAKPFRLLLRPVIGGNHG